MQPPVGGLRPGDACHLSLGGVEVDATVAVRHAPRTIAFVVPAWNDALLFVEREGMKETHQLGVWLSLYGVPETTAAPLRQGLADVALAIHPVSKEVCAAAARTVPNSDMLRPMRELTLRGIVLGGLITLLFTAANVYLGLKVGITFATSIPAAVISMAVLRFVRGSTILENNIVQTIASAAGTLAAIIFVLPGLIMIG